jgi:hypothetical protein
MPQITKPSLLLALALMGSVAVLSVAGCGSSNEYSNYDTDRGKHPAGWVPEGHVFKALTMLDSCMQCHGSDLAGGISKVACAQCHQGHFTEIHPPEWDGFVYARHGAYVNQRGTSFCASAFCHGVALQGVPGSGPSCTSCHIDGPLAVHPWKNQAEDFATSPPQHAQYVFVHGGTTASCRNATCHGADLQGVLLSGPACSSCHFAHVFPQ